MNLRKKKKQLVAAALAALVTLGAGVPTMVAATPYSLCCKKDTDIAYAVTGGNIYFDPATGTITGCDAEVTEAKIPSTINGVAVTGIAGGIPDWTVPEGSFAYCKNLTSVEIPDGVTSIGLAAFRDCKSLKNVKIPASVTDMGLQIFCGCENLKSAGPIGGDYNIQFGWSDSIPEYAFSYSNLTDIVIPDGVTSIGEDAFYDCKSLKNIKIPASVTNMGSQIFRGCENLNSAGPIGGDYNIQLGWSNTIPENAFSFCTNLASVKIPDGITSIKSSAFVSCTSLESVDIPDSVKNIDDSAFYNCRSLKKINIPDGVISIGHNAFYGCSSLKNITIPASVTDMGSEVFCGCDELKSAGPIGGDYNIQLGWSKIIPENAFFSCTNLASVEIPDGITGIKNNAFHSCRSLESVSIPDSVKYIDDSVFCFCENLKSVTIPSSVTEIGRNVFADCTKLKSAGPIGDNYNIQFGWSDAIPNNAFEGCGLTSVKIPDSVKSIGEYAFQGCSSLPSITIPDSVKSMGSSCFWNCSMLANIVMPAGITSIGHNAFSGCALTNITIPDGVTEIQSNTFAKCRNLESVTIPNTVQEIDNEVFSGCVNLTDIYYAGREVDWQNIQKDDSKVPISASVTVHYGNQAPTEPTPPTPDESGTKPAALTSANISKTSNSITVTNIPENATQVVLKKDGTVIQTTGVPASKTVTFRGLSPNSTYQIIAKNNSGESEPLDVTTSQKSSSSGSSGRRPSGGSSSNNPTTTTTTPTVQTKPNQPTTGVLNPVSTQNGNATVSDTLVQAAITKAQQTAQSNGTVSTQGIAVSIPVSVPNGQNSMNIILSGATVNRLVSANVKSLEITSNQVTVSFDTAALKHISNTASSNDKVILQVNRQTTLPLHDIKLVRQSGNTTTPINTFPGGKVTVKLPYTPSGKENTGKLQAMYIDDNGNVEWVANSRYDAAQKAVIMEVEHFSFYGVGYNPSANTTLSGRVNLDTSSVNVKGSYSFLVKGNHDIANIKVEVTNPNVASVVLEDAADSRGTRYRITAKSAGSTDVRVTYQGQTSTIKANVQKSNGSITLDTAQYFMAPGNQYTIGALLKDEAGNSLSAEQIKAMIHEGKLKVTDSRTGSVADLAQLENGNFQVTGKNEGTAYIIYEVGGTHASVRIDVQKDVKQHGTAVRNTSYFMS